MLNNFLESSFEQNIILLIQKNLLFLAPFFKQIGILCISNIFLIVILILYVAYDKKMAKIIAISYIFTSALSGFLKSFVNRQRPFQANSLIQRIQAPNAYMDIFSPASHHQASGNIQHSGSSFPSGHASSGTSFYGSIANYMRNKYITIICIFIIILIGFSRIFLGVHFLSDVIAGIIIGLLSVFFISFLFEKFDSIKLYTIIFTILLIMTIILPDSRTLISIATFLGFALAFIFEEKFVDFKITHDLIPVVLRIVCGAILYIALEYLFGTATGNPQIRIIGGFLTNFLVFGVYPWVFNKISIFSGSDA